MPPWQKIQTMKLSYRRKFIFIALLFSFADLHSQNADIRILRCINKPVNVGLDRTARGFTNSIAPVAIAVPAGLLLYEHYRENGNMRKPLVIWSSIAVTTGIALSLKYTVNRDRPFVTYSDVIQKDHNIGPKSFPSGHTSTAFALATSVSLEYPKWYVIAPSYAWACAVGYSRMRLGVHYPTDVFAGAIIGAGCAWGCWWLNKKLVEPYLHRQYAPDQKQ
jgi:membrane-associated phospholipid phosphatase